MRYEEDYDRNEYDYMDEDDYLEDVDDPSGTDYNDKYVDDPSESDYNDKYMDDPSRKKCNGKYVDDPSRKKCNGKYVDDPDTDDRYIDDRYIDDTNTEYTHCDDKDHEHKNENYLENKRQIEVDEIIGFGHGQITTEVCIPLCPPAFEILEKDIRKHLVFDAVIAGNKKVFINARLIKNIPFKTKSQTVTPRCNKVSRIVFGDIKHATAEIPITICIDVPGAKKGDKVVVLKFNVDSTEILNHLNCAPNSCIGLCEPAALKLDICHKPLFKSVTEKNCITVKVKVVRPTIIQMS